MRDSNGWRENPCILPARHGLIKRFLLMSRLEFFMRRRIPSIGMLLAFEAAGRSLNFTQAGEKLNLSQSAISHQILGLEEFLGLQLFERANRRLALTDEERCSWRASRQR